MATNLEQAKSLLIKPVSGDCNLHCEYCFYHERASDPYKTELKHRMSDQVLETMIQQFMAMDRRGATFGWQGGEPTLAGLEFFQKAVELQQKHGTRGQIVSNGLQTNGLLLTPEWARFLREYRFLVGVSLDGPANYHDRYRTFRNGQGSHDQVISNIRMLERFHVEYNILTVVNATTAMHGPEIYDYLASQGFTYMQFIPCVEVDPVSGDITDFSVDPDAYGEFLCAVFDRWYNGGHPQASVRDFEAILAVYLGQQAPLCCYQEQCGGYVVVEYNGDIYPCDFMVREDLYLGNLMDKPLPEMFASAGLKRFALAKAIARPECEACTWLPFCNQNCPRFVGLDGTKRHYLCRSYQRFYAYSHGKYMDLRDKILEQQGIDPQTVPEPPFVNRQVRPGSTVNRNDPCPCGSGIKFKNCCGRRGKN